MTSDLLQCRMCFNEDVPLNIAHFQGQHGPERSTRRVAIAAYRSKKGGARTCLYSVGSRVAALGLARVPGGCDTVQHCRVQPQLARGQGMNALVDSALGDLHDQQPHTSGT